MAITLTHCDGIALLDLGDDENRFSPEFLDELDAHLDEVAASQATGLPTAAAINGHAFGAAAMLTMAHDFRAMRADRGFFCFPEVDIRIPFTPGMAALIQAKLTPQTAVAAMTTGRRFGGTDAQAVGIVDVTATDGAVTKAACDLLRPLGAKHRGTLGAIKNTMFGAAVAVLTGD